MRDLSVVYILLRMDGVDLINQGFREASNWIDVSGIRSFVGTHFKS